MYIYILFLCCYNEFYGTQSLLSENLVRKIKSIDESKKAATQIHRKVKKTLINFNVFYIYR